MHGLSRNSVTLAVIFAGINIMGLAWIHHSLTHCPQATVRVLSASLQPDADSPDRFRLTFDRELVDEDAVGRTEKAEVFSLAPSVPGKWVWSARDRLEYLLDKPLPVGCMMKLAATDQLKDVTGRTLEGAAEFQLAARPLRLLSCDVTASDRQDISSRSGSISRSIQASSFA